MCEVRRVDFQAQDLRLSEVPQAGEAVPAAVLRLAGEEPVRPVWQNEAGGLTFEVGSGVQRRFVKWAPVGSPLDLASEAVRLRWAVRHASVPRLLAVGGDQTGAWLVTAALPGENAVSPRWQAAPVTAVRSLGQGLRRLHDFLPVAECPFTWAAADRVADARRRASAGQVNVELWHSSHRHLSIAEALRLVAVPPPVDELVVCHGDACAPNTLLDAEGAVTGHVDLGLLGVGDRWADLAIATWSAGWNYGPGWEGALLDAYGIAPDPSRTAYYRLLWDLAA